MGTNFYWNEKTKCPCCNRDFESIHIGKSSAGWVFALYVDTCMWINELESMISTIGNKDLRFLDLTSKMSMAERKWSESDYKVNHAELGPNNLVRAKIDGYRCIGHGSGTWDLIQGNFS